MRILFAEDEKALSKVIVKIFEKNNYAVDAVYNGADALVRLETGCYDVAVLDIMMPKMDGISVLQKIRAKGNRTPVLMLTAKAEIEDRVLGLDSGANDYLAKPFDSRELLARIRSLVRTKSEQDVKLQMGNVTLDRATFELSSPTGSFRLANKEYQMMEYMMFHPSRWLSNDLLMGKIWGEDAADSEVVWVYISYLRKKLEALGATIQIHSTLNGEYALEEIYE